MLCLCVGSDQRERSVQCSAVQCIRSLTEGAIGTGPGRHDSGLGELVGVSAGGVVVLTARVARARVLQAN